jgi:hypothetical protein
VRRAERLPGAGPHVDHRLAGLERLQHVAQLLRDRLGLLRVRIGEHVDQLAGHQHLVLAEGDTVEEDRRGADARAADADVEHVVVAGRALVLDRRLAHEQVAAQVVHRLRVRHRERAPVAGNRGVEVHQVVPVEDDLLGIDLGPADAQAVEKSEFGSVHGGRAAAE